jgi:hypothetical protein
MAAATAAAQAAQAAIAAEDIAVDAILEYCGFRRRKPTSCHQSGWI